MYLTIQQVAEKLQIPVTTVKHLIAEGRLKHTRINANNVRVKEEDLYDIKSAPVKKRPNNLASVRTKGKTVSAPTKPAGKKEPVKNGKAEKETVPAG
jgi:excisionase family DNA binding protein